LSRSQCIVATLLDRLGHAVSPIHTGTPSHFRYGPFDLRHKVAGAETTGFAQVRLQHIGPRRRARRRERSAAPRQVTDTKHGWRKVVIQLMPPKATTPLKEAPSDVFAGFPSAGPASTPPLANGE